MNFLAHAVLSFEEPELMVGNFIADFVKGNDYLQYPDPVKRGILLHRDIDQYTDQHPTVRLSKSKLYDPYGHYSGVIVDMYYDHFLAANFFKFHRTQLPSFTYKVYQTIGNYDDPLPEKVSMILYHMSRGNWLLSYATIAGIDQALKGLARRTKFNSGMELAGDSLRENYRSFYQDFMIFFPQVMSFARDQIERI